MGKRPTPRNERVNVTEYKEGEDIASFLEAFKGMMALNEVEEEDWLKYLVPSLTGKAREVSQYMEYDKCTYRDLKERLMKHFEVTTEAQRRKFREMKWKTESTPEAYVWEGEQLIQRWLTEDMSPDEIRQQLVIEQLLSGMPKEMRTWWENGSQSKLTRWWS